MYTTLDAGDKRFGLFSLKSNKKIKIIAKKKFHYYYNPMSILFIQLARYTYN